MMNTRDKLNLMKRVDEVNERHIKDFVEGSKMFKIVMTAGSVKKDMFTGLTRKEAEEMCESYGWVVRPDGDGGFEWDLEIEEE